MVIQLLNKGIVEETLMPAYPTEQLRNWPFVNTIQVLEELVDRVFHKHHFKSEPAPPPTVRFRVAPPPTVRFKVMEEFQKIKELFKAA